jgi:hypothetical protein
LDTSLALSASDNREPASDAAESNFTGIENGHRVVLKIDLKSGKHIQPFVSDDYSESGDVVIPAGVRLVRVSAGLTRDLTGTDYAPGGFWAKEGADLSPEQDKRRGIYPILHYREE